VVPSTAGALVRDYDLHFITLALTEAEQSIAEDEQSRLNVGVVIAREHVNWRAHTEGTTSVSRPRQDALCRVAD
jgi:hypothetical protein